jgi:predicted nucleotidyltransferase
MYISYIMNQLELLFPKARVELFKHLLLPPTPQLHLRELARLSSLAVGTIQREVKILLSAGVIQERRDGNRLYFEADKSNPIFQELQSMTLKTTGASEVIRKAVGLIQGIDFSFIYGSFADGTADHASDIDLMVIGKCGLRKLSSPLREASEKINREINPTVYTANHFKERFKKGDAFLTQVFESEKLWISGNSNEFEAMAKQRLA